MFISIPSTDSSAWASQSPQDSQQAGQTFDHQKVDAMLRTYHDRYNGAQPQGIGEHEPATPSPDLSVDIMSRALGGLPASYASEPSGKLHPDPVKPGVRVDENGRRYISDGVNTYAIRHDRDNRTERVYQPDNPTKPGIPVRLNTHGDYERHDEVGLKGGSPGRELQMRLNHTRGQLENALAERRQAENELATIDAEMRRFQNPGMDLTMRRQQAQRNRERTQHVAQGHQWQMESLLRDAHQLRQTMQNELTQLRRRRDDGTQLGQTTQHEINVLEATLRMSDPPSADTQYKLQKLQSDLRRIQDANATLDYRIMALHAEMDDIPRS